jgi:hypothetical protein
LIITINGDANIFEKTFEAKVWDEGFGRVTLLL